MTKLARRGKGREASDPLPNDLTSMTAGQVRQAVAEREARIREVAVEGRTADTATREQYLSEASVLSVELAALREAGGDQVEHVGGFEGARALVLRRGPGTPTPRARTQAEIAVAAIRANYSLPTEVGPVTLYAANLSEAEGEELYALLLVRHDPDGPGMTDEQLDRFRALVEVAAGRPVFADLDARAEIARLVEEVRLAQLPPRVEFAEVGSVHLPAACFAPLRSQRNAGLTVGDIGALAAVLYAFEVEDASLVEHASFERDSDGEPFLALRGREARFAAHVQPPPTASNGTRTDLDLALHNFPGLLDVRRSLGRIEVRLAAGAKALRSGRPPRR